MPSLKYSRIAQVCSHIQAARHALKLIDLAVLAADVAPNGRRGRPRRRKGALEQQTAGAPRHCNGFISYCSVPHT